MDANLVACPLRDWEDVKPLIDVLLIEDSRLDALRIEQMFRQPLAATFHLEHVDRLEAGIRILGERPFDVVLLDLTLPDGQGLDTFLRLYARYPEIPIVAITASNDNQLVAEVLQRGAQDYLFKCQLNSDMIFRSIRYAVERNRRQQAERHILDAQREERRRLAGELHDGVIQSLSSMRLQLQMLHAQIASSEGRTADTVRTIADESMAAIEEVRRVSHDLHPLSLEKRNLAEAIVLHVDDILTECGPEIEIRDLGHEPLNASTKEHVYRIVQESLRNAMKHAGASQLEVLIQGQTGWLAVEIRDDGKGFHVQDVESSNSGLGLVSISERARLLGGDCHIESQPGTGTVIRVEVPV